MVKRIDKIEYRGFSGGLNIRPLGTDIAENQRSRSQNVTHEVAGSIQTRSGTARYNTNAAPPVGQVQNMTASIMAWERFYPPVGASHLVILTVDGSLWQTVDANNTYQVITTGLAVGAHASMRQIEGVMYIARGSGSLLAWDGTNLRASVGLAATTAPTTAIVTDQALAAPPLFPNLDAHFTTIRTFESELYMTRGPTFTDFQRYTTSTNVWDARAILLQAPHPDGHWITGLANGVGLRYSPGDTGAGYEPPFGPANDTNRRTHRFNRGTNAWADVTATEGPVMVVTASGSQRTCSFARGGSCVTPNWGTDSFVSLWQFTTDAGGSPAATGGNYILARWPEGGRPVVEPVMAQLSESSGANNPATTSIVKSLMCVTDTVGHVYIMTQHSANVTPVVNASLLPGGANPPGIRIFRRYDTNNGTMTRLPDFLNDIADGDVMFYPRGSSATFVWLHRRDRDWTNGTRYNLQTNIWEAEAPAQADPVGRGPAISPGSGDGFLYFFEAATAANPSTAFRRRVIPGVQSLTIRHEYQVSFVSALVESNGSPKPGEAGQPARTTPPPAGAALIEKPGGAATTLTIPLGPAGTTARRIYRTVDFFAQPVASLPPLFLVATVSDNTTTIYSDTVADGALGSLQPQSTNNQPPVNASLIASVAGRLFLAGFSDDPSKIHWSDVNKAEAFPAFNTRPLDKDDGDPINALLEFDQDRLLILKASAMWVMNFDPANADAFMRMSTRYGSISRRGAIMADRVAYFLSQDGIYRFDGSEPRHVSDKVDTLISTLTGNQRALAAIGFHKHHLLCSLVDPAVSTTENRIVLDFDTRDQSWSATHNATVKAWVNLPSQADNDQMHFAPVAAGGHSMWAQGTTDIGVAIPFDVETGDLLLGDQYRPKWIRKLAVLARIPTGETMTVSCTMDRGRQVLALGTITGIANDRREYPIYCNKQLVARTFRFRLQHSGSGIGALLDGVDILDAVVYETERGDTA